MTGHVRIDGTWKDVDSMSVKVGGAWKGVDKGFTKVNGVWKEYYTAYTPITATGGTIVDRGNYRYHIFRSSDTFSISDLGTSNGEVHAIVHDGGQSGQGMNVWQGQFAISSGGGDSGEARAGSMTVSAGSNYSVVVGAAASSSSLQGLSSFSNSSIASGGTGFSMYSDGSYTLPGNGQNGEDLATFGTIPFDNLLSTLPFQQKTGGGGSGGSMHFFNGMTWSPAIEAYHSNTGSAYGALGGSFSYWYDFSEATIEWGPFTLSGSDYANSGAGGIGGIAAWSSPSGEPFSNKYIFWEDGCIGSSGYVIIGYSLTGE